MSMYPHLCARALRQGLIGLAAVLALASPTNATVEVPKQLSLAAVGQAHALGAAAAAMDQSTVAVVICLVAVPLVTATIAFVCVETQLRKEEDGEIAPPRAERHSAPRPAQRGAGLQQEPSMPLRPSLAHPATSGSLAHPATNGSAAALLTGRLQPPPVFLAASRPGTALTHPPSLPLLTTPSLTPPEATPAMTPRETEASLPFPTEASLPNGGRAEPRASPLSTALVVRNPDGVLVRLDGDLMPHPERRTINVTSIRDANTILCAHVSELSMDDAWIHVETKAKNIPIATLDTRSAIFPNGGIQPSPDRRRVVLHRVGHEDGEGVGPACAYVAPAGFRKFNMVYLPESGTPAMTLYMAYGGVHIERIMDGQGHILARSETLWQPSGGPGQKALWVREGTDMALVACAMLATQKLAEWVDEGACLNT